MRFRTSCFNPALGKNALRRFWPLPLVVFGAVLMALTLPVLGAIQESGSTVYMVQERIYGKASTLLILTAAAAFLSAELAFHHLHSRREIQFFHALPLKRRCLYLTGLFTGYLLIAVPEALGIGLTMLLSAALGAGGAAGALAELLGVGLLSLLLFYSLAALACCIAGQALGAVLIYGGMNCAALIILKGAGGLASVFMPGLTADGLFGDLSRFLTPLYALISATEVCYREIPAPPGYWADTMQVPTGFSQPWVLAVYGALGAALAVLAGVLYEKRRAETAGEMTAFRPVRGLCRIFGTLVVAVAGACLTLSTGLFQGEIPFGAVAGAALLFAAVGWFASEMVIQKTLRVFHKRTAVSCGILLAVLLAVMGAGRLDLLGTVRRVPEPETVASAELQYDYYGSPVDLSPEDAAALHRTVLDNREALTNHADTYDKLILTYRLKNGRALRREYMVLRDYDDLEAYVPNPITDAVLVLLEKPEYNYQTWFGELGGVTAENFTYASVQFYQEEDDEGLWLEPSSAGLGETEAGQLYEAMLRDIREGTMPSYVRVCCGGESIGYVGFDARIPGSGGAGTVTCYVNVELTAEMKNTLACLEDMGVCRP